MFNFRTYFPIEALILFSPSRALRDTSTVMQEGWCDSVGSVEQIQTKLFKRQEAAAKRERAMAYALAHQVKYYNLCWVTKLQVLLQV